MALGIYFFVELSGITYWKRRAFKGLVLLRRTDHVQAAIENDLNLEELVAGDHEIAQTGLNIKRVGTEEYFVQINPRGGRRRVYETFIVGLVGRIRFRNSTGELEMTVLLPRFWLFTFVLGFLFSSSLSFAEGSPLSLVFWIVVNAIGWYTFFRLSFKSGIEEFFFLLSMKLREITRGSGREQ